MHKNSPNHVNSVSLYFSLDDAIAFINAREKPLTLYVFSSDDRVQNAFRDRTSSGGLVFNDTLLQMAVESLPFGGVGNSGMGQYHGQVRDMFA